MSLDDLVDRLFHVVDRHFDNSVVRQGSLVQSDWNFQFVELVDVLWVGHFFIDDALLHLSNVLFFDHSDQVFESVVNFFWVELVGFSDALAQEVKSSFFG
jgi:hypothetical protein